MLYRIDIVVWLKDDMGGKYVLHSFPCSHESIELNKARVLDYIKYLNRSKESIPTNTGILILESNGESEIIYYNDPKNIESIHVKIHFAGVAVS